MLRCVHAHLRVSYLGTEDSMRFKRKYVRDPVVVEFLVHLKIYPQLILERKLSPRPPCRLEPERSGQHVLHVS